MMWRQSAKTAASSKAPAAKASAGMLGETGALELAVEAAVSGAWRAGVLIGPAGVYASAVGSIEEPASMAPKAATDGREVEPSAGSGAVVSTVGRPGEEVAVGPGTGGRASTPGFGSGVIG